MADLTTLEEKLAEMVGLAQAARGATEKVEGVVHDEEIVTILKQMREEAEETERRCTDAADARENRRAPFLPFHPLRRVTFEQMLHLGNAGPCCGSRSRK